MDINRILLENILQEIMITNKLMAISITKGLKFEEQVNLLSQVGLTPKSIAETLGKTPNHVSVTLHKLKKNKKI